MQLPLKSGYYLRAVFIKLRGIATANEAEIKEPDPFTNVYEDEKELEKTVSPLLSAILKL